MPADRFFSPDRFSLDHSVELADGEARHLISVMRGKVGDSVEVVNGKGQLARARIAEISKRSVLLDVCDVEEQAPDSYRVIIAQAIPRSNRLDTIVEKGCELGMTELWLFPGERSERRSLSTQQEKRLQTVSVAALKQCGRLYLPDIQVKAPLKKWDKLPDEAYFGDLDPEAPPLQDVWDKQGNASIFFVGPEAGFTDAEEQYLRDIGAKGVKLHGNILRTDTASLVALSLIQHWRL